MPKSAPLLVRSFRLDAYLDARPGLREKIRAHYRRHLAACRALEETPTPWGVFALEIVNMPARARAEVLAPEPPPAYEPITSFSQYAGPIEF